MTRIIAIVFAGTVAIAVGMPSPAAAQNREHQQMAADVRMLQEQTQLLALEVAKSMQQLAAAVKTIEARLDAAEAANRKMLADQKLNLDALASDIRIVRERTQDVNTRIGTLTEEVEAMRGSVAALSSLALQPAAPVDGAATNVPGAIDQAVPPPAAARTGLSPSRLFQTAFADYTIGQYSLAISGFQAFLNEFPGSEQADDAKYYIGYSYQLQKRYPEAVKAFNEVIQNYPNGDRVPEAYVDLGNVQRALGNTDAARETWQTVLQKYPTSNSAIIAKQRLDGLPPPPPKP